MRTLLRLLAMTSLCAVALADEPAVIGDAPVAAETVAPAAVTGPVFPGEDWAVGDPVAHGLNATGLAKLDAWSFRRDGDEQNRLGQRTNALIIVRGGEIVYERYARDTTADTRLLTWSVSKSMASLLVGVAVGQGLLDLKAPAGQYFPPLATHGHGAVTVEDLLRMTSGIAWGESYETSPLFSSVLHMLYTRGHDDMAGFLAKSKQVYPAGTHWSYSSGDSNASMAVLRAVIPPEQYASWPWTQVFDPIGMRHVTWERDVSGTFIGSSYLYAPARELARWGWLMRNDGVWNGQRVLPEGWVSYATTLSEAWYHTDLAPGDREDNPGAWWYLNKGDPARNLPKPWPDLPDDTYAAFGHWGKSMWVIPSWDMVVVRMGDDRQYACERPEQTDCQADPEKAFGKHRFTQLLAEVAR